MLNKILYFFVALVVITGVLKVVMPPQVSVAPTEEAVVENHKTDLIRVTEPLPNSVVLSPLTIRGEARGNWFFEASFPIVLTDWDGLIIAEGYATAEGEWMTTEFVPFTASLIFTTPYKDGDPDFMKRGALILKKDNPSGLPEHDDAQEIPIRFAP